MKVLAHISLAVLVGSIACVSFVVAPAAFAALDDPDQAAGLLGDVFTTVDLLGIVAAILLLVAWSDRLSRILGGLIGLSSVANLFVVAPQVKDANIWHHISVTLWMLTLLAGVAFLIRQARKAAKVA